MRNELRYAVRGLLRDRVFALMIVLSLAVGIGANTAIFSLVNGVLLQPPDYPHPERLVALTQWAPKLLKSYPDLPVNISIFQEWRKHITSFESAGIAEATVFNLTGEGRPGAGPRRPGHGLDLPRPGRAAAPRPRLHRPGRPGRPPAGRHPLRCALAPPLPGRPRHRGPQSPGRRQALRGRRSAARQLPLSARGEGRRLALPG